MPMAMVHGQNVRHKRILRTVDCLAAGGICVFTNTSCLYCNGKKNVFLQVDMKLHGIHKETQEFCFHLKVCLKVIETDKRGSKICLYSYWLKQVCL